MRLNMAITLALILVEETLSFQVPFIVNPINPSRCIQNGRRVHHRNVNSRPKASFEIHSTPSSPSDQGGESSNNNNEISDDFLFESLRKRQSEIETKTNEIEQKWCDGVCQTSAPLQLNDWIRRVALDKWPIVAVGTAQGSVVVADLSDSSIENPGGTVLASAHDVHEQYGEGEDIQRLLDLIYGRFDGGGVLAIAMKNNIVVSAGREGGIKIWRFDPIENKLISQGQPSSLDGVQVTALTFHDGDDGDEESGFHLWVGSFDKKIRKFKVETTTFSLRITKPLVIDLDSEIISLTTNSDIGLCACGMADGSITLISTLSGEILSSSWKPFGNTCARSVAIVEVDHNTFNLISGGGDGTIYIRSLSLNSNSEISPSKPYNELKEPEELKPSHGGPVVSIAARKGGLFVTGAHDGSLRVWDCVWDRRPDYISATTLESDLTPTLAHARYQLLGYKVWLGSVCIDEEGRYLFSDGSDNAIVLHDFSLSDQSNL